MRRGLADLGLALVPGVLFALTDLAQRHFAGRVEAFGSVGAYRTTLDAVSLARYALLFAGVLLVWGWLRGRGATTLTRGVALLAAPAAYSLLAFDQATLVFSAGEALYYAVNPVWLAAVGSQAACAGVAELAWRLRHRRVAAWWLPAAVIVAGWTVTYATVLWDGGVHWFYVYQQGYRALFGG